MNNNRARARRENFVTALGESIQRRIILLQPRGMHGKGQFCNVPRALCAKTDCLALNRA